MAGLRVAISGTNSFLGKGLMERLASDPQIEHILAVEHQPPMQRQGKVHYRRIDLIHPRSGEDLADALGAHEIDAFVHTAFLSRPIHRGGWAHELEAIGTRHVVAAVEAAATRKLILRSTTLNYGAFPSNPMEIREDTPLLGKRQGSFIADKVEAETQVFRLAQRHPDRVITVLRLAPLLGYTRGTIAAAYLDRRLCPTLVGFEPLIQLLHEEDAYRALKAALLRDVQGAVNVAAPGVMALRDVIRQVGARPLPLLRPMARSLASTLWAAQMGSFPAGLVNFLRYSCVSDTTRMREELHFQPQLDLQATLSLFAGQRLGEKQEVSAVEHSAG